MSVDRHLYKVNSIEGDHEDHEFIKADNLKEAEKKAKEAHPNAEVEIIELTLIKASFVITIITFLRGLINHSF